MFGVAVTSSSPDSKRESESMTFSLVVSTGLVVQALARPEWLVEIDGTAVIPD
jgi:hypothetical protein